jgi:hypothetical protein
VPKQKTNSAKGRLVRKRRRELKSVDARKIMNFANVKGDE